MNLKLKRTPGIYLVGFMCCGKTTIGRASSMSNAAKPSTITRSATCMLE